MEQKAVILADSTCDLSPALLRQYDIHILPLNIVLDGEAYADGTAITPDEIYRWAQAHGATPKTAAPSPAQALAALEPLAALDRPVICFGISEQMSASCQVMRLAAAEAGLKEWYVIDSRNLSTGIGLQVIRAAELAEAGVPAGEIAARIEAARDQVRASFVVDTLTYLARGGRCSAVTALLGNALRLKPKIAVENGAMGVTKKYRGSQERVIADYVADLGPQLARAEPAHIFITHSGVPQEVLDQTRRTLEDLHYFAQIHITRAGGVISSHCGPGTLGVLFYEKPAD